MKKVFQENLLKMWHSPLVAFIVNGHQNFWKLKKVGKGQHNVPHLVKVSTHEAIIFWDHEVFQ